MKNIDKTKSAKNELENKITELFLEFEYTTGFKIVGIVLNPKTRLDPNDLEAAVTLIVK